MKVIKNYLYNVGYQVFLLIVPIITVPYTSRVLGSEGIGINAFTNSIIQYFILFGSIGINLYGNRTIAYNRENSKKLKTTFWEISIIRILFISISYLFFLFFLFFVDEYREYFLYQSILIIAAGLDISWLFMGLEDFKKTVVRNILVKITSIFMIFIFVKSEKDVGIYILILSGSILMGNLLLWGYIKPMFGNVKFKQLNLKKHIKPSISLFIPQIATQVYLILNKTMLGVLTNVENVAFYEQSDKIVKIILAVVTATGTVMLPRVASVFAKGELEKVKYYLTTSFEFVSFICFPLAFGLSSISEKFSVWFLGEGFEATGQLISILSFVIIFIGWSNVLGTQYLLPTNQTKYYTQSVITGAVLNIFLNIFLIRELGVMGAVIATVLSEFIVTLVQIYFTRKTIELKILFGDVWKYFISSGIMYACVKMIHTNMDGNLMNFSFQILVGAVIYIIVVWLLKARILIIFKKFLLK
ncbi:flippase [Enterococcus eurekensis]|uniref:Flippase n=1 Tax=Enterococcus eurekensis TaxID=1159753 RepID=A0ABV9M4N4_9ENTE